MNESIIIMFYKIHKRNFLLWDDHNFIDYQSGAVTHELDYSDNRLYLNVNPILIETLDNYFEVTQKAWEYTKMDLIMESETSYYIILNERILKNYLTYYIKFI